MNSTKTKAPNYLLLHVPGGKKPVRFARVGGPQPQVDVRSVVESMGMGWQRWEICIRVLCGQQGWPLFAAVDVANRSTRLLWASHVPHLLTLLGTTALEYQQAAGRRILALAAIWGKAWVRVNPPDALNRLTTAPCVAGYATAPKTACGASYGLSEKKSAVIITRDVEMRVQTLVAQGLSFAEIGRQLKISRSSASLIASGKYSFSASESGRGVLGYGAQLGHAKLTVESFDQIQKLLTLGVSQSDIGRALRLSKSAVNRVALGQTVRDGLPNDWRLNPDAAEVLAKLNAARWR